MISLQKLIKLARKWHKVAAAKRKRIPSKRNNSGMDADTCTPSVASKGHFVVYSANNQRFEIPLLYLGTTIFRELFRMSEDEFGLPTEGPITIPCDSAFIEYVISFIRRPVTKDLESALLLSLANGHRPTSSSSLHHGKSNESLLVCAC